MRKLRRIRAEKGLTMDALEERTGVSKRTISEIERGMRTPQTLTLAKLANALDVELDDLLEDEAPKAQAPLPLELAGQLEKKAATEISYTAFEVSGRVLAARWSGELETWEEQAPDGEVPDSFDFGRMFQWSLEIAHTCKHYNDIARHDGQVPRPELEETLAEMTNAAWKVGVKVKRVFETAKTSVEFQKIVEANNLEAMLSSAEIDG